MKRYFNWWYIPPPPPSPSVQLPHVRKIRNSKRAEPYLGIKCVYSLIISMECICISYQLPPPSIHSLVLLCITPLYVLCNCQSVRYSRSLLCCQLSSITLCELLAFLNSASLLVVDNHNNNSNM